MTKKEREYIKKELNTYRDLLELEYGLIRRGTVEEDLCYITRLEAKIDCLEQIVRELDLD